MLEGSTKYSTGDLVKAWIPSFLFGGIGAYLIATMGEYTFLDAFSLIIHEAGHVIFRFFGQTIYMLGGTLMQIIIPVLLMIFFFANHKTAMLQFSMLLLSQNLLNISVYVADAQTRKLRLFGPPGVIHDWNWLLGSYGILHYSEDIAMLFIVLAVLTLVLMFFLPYFLRHR